MLFFFFFLQHTHVWCHSANADTNSLPAAAVVVECGHLEDTQCCGRAADEEEISQWAFFFSLSRRFRTFVPREKESPVFPPCGARRSADAAAEGRILRGGVIRFDHARTFEKPGAPATLREMD